MSTPLNCPNCGGEVQVATKAARTASCSFCGSVLVVNEEAIKALGKMALFADTPSCLAVGWRAKCLGREIEVLGRIQFKYHSGLWDEWWVRFLDNDETMWISQDEGVYMLEKPVNITSGIPAYDSCSPGDEVVIARRTLLVEEKDVGEMVGMQGELPIGATPEGKMSYLELANDRIKCTIEYFEDGDVEVFQGKYLKPSELKAITEDGSSSGLYPAPALAQPEDLRKGGIVRSEDSAKVQSTNCPNCGGSIEIRDAKKSAMIVCQYCGGALDVSAGGTPKLLYEMKGAKRGFPIEIGEKGKFKGIEYTVIGRVTFQEEGIYTWDSLQLFNPVSGYVFLERENGHWMFFTPLKHPVRFNPRIALPKQKIRHRGQTFKVYETGACQIIYVEGELTWVARLGDAFGYLDAIRPPNMLSAEWTPNEMEWSYGTYMPRKTVAEAFGKKTEDLGIARPTGVAPAQPFVRTKRQRIQAWVGLIAALFLFLMAGYTWLFGTAGSEVLLNAQVPPAYMSDQGWISPTFEVPAGTHICELHAYARGLSNEWTALAIAFLDEEENVVLDADVMLEYYRGRTGGESWAEGSLDDYALLRLEGPATYHLNAFGQSGTWSRTGGDRSSNQAHNVQIVLRSDVSVTRYYLIAFLLVCWYPLWEFGRQILFESRRWPSEEDD